MGIKLLNYGKRLSGVLGSRSMSTVSNLTTVEVNDKTGTAILTLNRAPVNGLNLELLTSIKESIKAIQKNNSRGLILTSFPGETFSTGIDLSELYNPDIERLKHFWSTFQDLWLYLYGSTIPTAAAINGHCLAAGCVMASSCEYRVMLPNFTLRLNDTQFGLAAPKWFIASFLNVLPKRIVESALIQGSLFTADEALKIGLVDEIASDEIESVEKCERFLDKFATIDPLARATTKQQFRSDELQCLEANKEKDLNLFVAYINHPSVQNRIKNEIHGLNASCQSN